jgi:hypothetical protein
MKVGLRWEDKGIHTSRISAASYTSDVVKLAEGLRGWYE